MIVASIDIGTNTVLLLIAELDIKTLQITALKNETRMPRIGQGIKKSGVISLDKLELLYSVLEEYNIEIKYHNCDLVIVTGTNAFRLAGNTPLIISELKKKFDYDLNVISGEDEAEYAFAGAITGLDKSSNSLVIDIGGSSTEIIYGSENNILSKVSLQLGSVVATEQYLLHSPPLQSEISDLEIEIRKKISTIEVIDKPDQVIAIAGTATTIASMILGLKEFNETEINNFEIKVEMVKKLLDEIIHLTDSKILDKYGQIMKGREDIILSGVCILNKIMDSFGFDKVKVSTRGIRYGAIINHFRSKKIH
jgi:exopolyphosphatase / guanosine-5'-triphosphate,3'-diphosphate pyrophosphatase